MSNQLFAGIKMKRTGTVLGIILLAVLTMTLSACTSMTKISDVMTDSSKYTGKTITIKGTVGETVWLAAAEKGTYQLGDGSDTIWVISTQPPPEKGASVTTEGTVQSAFTILGKSYGTVLMETKRH